MAARLLDHFLTLRKSNSQPAYVDIASPARIQRMSTQQKKMEALLGDDVRYAALKACIRAPQEDIFEAQQRAWDLAHNLSKDHPILHPWALLMAALRGALSEEDRLDESINGSIDELEKYGTLLWPDSTGTNPADVAS